MTAGIEWRQIPGGVVSHETVVLISRSVRTKFRRCELKLGWGCQAISASGAIRTADGVGILDRLDRAPVGPAGVFRCRGLRGLRGSEADSGETGDEGDGDTHFDSMVVEKAIWEIQMLMRGTAKASPGLMFCREVELRLLVSGLIYSIVSGGGCGYIHMSMIDRFAARSNYITIHSNWTGLRWPRCLASHDGIRLRDHVILPYLISPHLTTPHLTPLLVYLSRHISSSTEWSK